MRIISPFSVNIIALILKNVWQVTVIIDYSTKYSNGELLRYTSICIAVSYFAGKTVFLQ
jgi:hypothetical protein